MNGKIARFPLLSRLGKDEGGHVLIYFTIMLPVIMGLIGLSLEAGRVRLLNSQLQNLADAAALAGAKQLDGNTGAISRATSAAKNLLTNDTWWSNIALDGVQIIDPPVFYSALKGLPSDNPAPNDVTTTSDSAATYIKVTTVNRGLAPAFLIAVGATSIAQTNATATAGSGSVACNVQPLMLCNPYEGTSDFHATAGQLFQLKPKGSNGSFSPGDFGLVDPPGQSSSGAKTIRNLLSQQSPNFCYVDRVSPRPGQATGDVSDAVNVRFDMTPNGNTSGLDQTPAPDVIKGIMTDPTKPQDACKANKYQPDSNWPSPPPPPSPASTAYTPNTGAFPGNTDMTAQGNVDIGSTMDQTAANAYWNYHHGANWPTGMTRYQAYLNELGLNGTAPSWVTNTEAHAPQCAPTNVRNSGDYKRRLISVAIVNCLANGVQGNSTTDIRSNQYAVFFITDPSPTSGSSAGTILAEFVESITPAGCAANPANPFCAGLHQVVQLYRDW